MTVFTWAEFLRMALKRSGKSAYQIAKDSGVSQMTVGEFIDGKRDIRLETAQALTSAVKFGEFTWVIGTLQVIDEWPEFAIKTAWHSVENSLDVGIQRGMWPKRVPRLKSTEEKIDCLVAQKLFTKAQGKRVRELQEVYQAAVEERLEMEREKIEEYVVESYDFVQVLWNMG